MAPAVPPPDPFDDEVTAVAVLEAMPRAVILLDPEGRIRFWNRQAEAVYGWRADEVVGRQAGELLIPADDLPEHRMRIASLAAGARTEGDRVVLRRDGTVMKVVSFAAPVVGDAGDVVAVVSVSGDVTDEREVQDQIRALNEHLRLALDAGRLGTWRWDARTQRNEWDEALEAIFGFEPGAYDGTFETYIAAIHPDDRDHLLATVADAMATGNRYRVEHRIVLPDGAVRWVACAGVVTADEQGEVTGTIGCVGDVSDLAMRQQALETAVAENRAGLERERQLRERFEFLSKVNESLNEAMDVRGIAARVAQVAVPRLGDRCELVTDFGDDPVSVVVPPGSEVGDGDHVVEVPLVKHGRVLGRMVLSRAAGAEVSDDDLTIADLVSNRVAATLENRRLVELHRSTAHALQQALLPGELPVLDGVDLAVGYWPAGEAMQVGGDFYDVFEAGDGRWALVVGDVCGTGAFAASVTGLARHSLREAVWHGDEPDEVLRSLNRAIRRSGFSTFCTAVYATLDVRDGVALSVTVGGHPLPIRTDGATASLIGEFGTLLGMVARTESTTVAVDVEPGEFVVFYTDGATDLPAPAGLDEDEMTELVRAAAARSATAAELAANIRLSLDERCAFVDRGDDVALLVLRRAAA